MTQQEAEQYLQEVYIENEYTNDPGWDFQTFLNSIYDAGLDEYSETVVECYQILQGNDRFEPYKLQQ